MNPVVRVLSKLKGRFTLAAFPDPAMTVARDFERLSQEGETLLGSTGGALFRRYGRLMSGAYSGQDVSALPGAGVRALLEALQRGDRIPVHLMHRHRSGCYDSSWLTLAEGRLLMHYPNRTEPAE